LMYMKEADVIGFVNKNNIPVVKSPCPVDKHTKREYIKDLLKEINRDNPGVKDRMFTAIKDSNIKGWNI
ncbi:MAG: tRNA 2-thiocytidine(32) synthetase TtcA, partial [Lachnospiraceae bacterium]|nr:tRNA 2-thiocytidine(32) synthetase TtcA [Lachnospiraceae bacterium]